MTTPKPLLLIPVENQVRELEPELLLARVAGRRGFSSVIGLRREMEMRIDHFPLSIYLSTSIPLFLKSMFKTPALRSPGRGWGGSHHRRPCGHAVPDSVCGRI